MRSRQESSQLSPSSPQTSSWPYPHSRPSRPRDNLPPQICIPKSAYATVPMPLPMRESGTCYHRRSRHCRQCIHSSVHWKRKCFADCTTTQRQAAASVYSMSDVSGISLPGSLEVEVSHQKWRSHEHCCISAYRLHTHDSQGPVRCRAGFNWWEAWGPAYLGGTGRLQKCTSGACSDA